MLAEDRYERLGDEAKSYLAEIEFNPGGQLISDIDSFRVVVELTSSPDVYDPFESLDDPVTEEKSSNNLLKWALLVTVVLAAALVARYFLAKRGGGSGVQKSAPRMAQEITSKMDLTDYGDQGESPPMHQFVTTYVLGDNLFDDFLALNLQRASFWESVELGYPKPLVLVSQNG